jgi:hypothetical protein
MGMADSSGHKGGEWGLQTIAGRKYLCAPFNQGGSAPIAQQEPSKRSTALDLILQRQKRDYNFKHYQEMSGKARSFFKNRGYVVANAVFEIMLELTKFKDLKPEEYDQAYVRRNGYMPGAAHEMGIVLPLLSLMDKDSDFQALIPEIERTYGSLEAFICIMIVHDMGEEKNWFARDIEDLIRIKLKRQGVSTDSAHEEIIKLTGQGMERLTDCRDFTSDEISKLTGYSVDLSNIKPGDPLDLGDLEIPIKERIWPKMDVLDDNGREFFQVFGFCDLRKKKPVIRVTRYGKTAENDEKKRLALSVSRYHHSVCAEVYAKLAKKMDTIDNLKTLIDKGDSPEKMRVYLEKKRGFWKETGFKRSIEETSPLYPYSQSLDKQMQFLMDVLDLHITDVTQHDNKDGKIVDVTEVFDYSSFFPDCEYAFKHVGFMNDPVCTILMQIYNAPDTSDVDYPTALFDSSKRDVLAVCSPQMASKIQKMDEYLQVNADACLNKRKQLELGI